MSLNLPGAPAFASLRPDVPVARAAEPALGATVSAALGTEGRLMRLTGTGTAGCYLFEPMIGNPLFLKIVAGHRCELMRAVDALTEGLGASAFACQRQREIAIGDHALIVYPYVPGRRLRADAADLRALGAAIAEMHTALARIESAEQIRAGAAAWFGQLEAVAARADTVAGFPKLAAICLMARPRPLDWGVDRRDAQVLHGDLNFGNVLMHDHTVTIVDFENAIRSFGPVLLDLAFALERFCFADSPNTGFETDLARALMAGYGDGAPRPSRQEIEDALTLHAGRALAVLAAKLESGMTAEPSEIEKFLFLVKDAPRKADVLADAFDGDAAPARIGGLR